jgi:hypothetical protein
LLQGHIALDQAVFPERTPGFVLDVLARSSLWKIGLDYRHGTFPKHTKLYSESSNATICLTGLLNGLHVSCGAFLFLVQAQVMELELHLMSMKARRA